MFVAFLKATNSSFQKGMTFYRRIYVTKVMKLLAFIFEQPSYKLRLTLFYIFVPTSTRNVQNTKHCKLHILHIVNISCHTQLLYPFDSSPTEPRCWKKLCLHTPS